MASLLLFNPENDLALAANSANYTPPAAAVRIRRAGALLPMWFAQPGDFILASPEMESAAAEMREKYRLHGKIFTSADIPEIDRCVPWGWSAHTVRTFRNAGISGEILPDSQEIECLRLLSHRRTSISILNALSFTSLPVEATTLDEAFAAVSSFGGSAYLKFPWSGSGRGVFPVASGSDSLRSLAAASIRRQGSVIIEPSYSPVTDFAMLFYCNGGKARFHGLSIFKTLPGGAYSGNIIASQEYIAGSIGLAQSTLDSLRSRLEKALTGCVAHAYDGPIGVDMMIADKNGKQIVVPCIEVNLRYTMGFVAQAIASATSPEAPRLLQI